MRKRKSLDKIFMFSLLFFILIPSLISSSGEKNYRWPISPDESIIPGDSPEDQIKNSNILKFKNGAK